MKKQQKRFSSLRAYAKFIATFKGRFFAVFGLFVASDILLALLPVFIGDFVATLSANSPSHAQVFWLVGVLIAISIGHDILWRSAEWLYRWLINVKGFEFENVVFRAVISKPYPYFIDKFTGKISSYVSMVGREFREFLNNIFYEYADLLVKLPIISVIMFSVNVPTGIVFVISIIIMFIAGKVLVG
ncbi:MAG TPA: hypothetical protein VIQ80_02090, partial [Candidatus Saccharimonadales bacterium]